MYYLIGNELYKGYCKVHSAVTAEGQAVFAEGASSAEGVVSTFISIAHKGQLSDKLFSLSKEFVASDLAWRILQQHVMDQAVRAIPAAVGPDRALYWSVYSLRPLECIDFDESRLTYFPKTTVVSGVDHYRFKKEVVENLDLFLTKYQDWIASDRLVQGLQAANVTGFKFTQIVD